MKKYINCILTWMSHVDIRTAFLNGPALLLGTLPYTFFPFLHPSSPFLFTPSPQQQLSVSIPHSSCADIGKQVWGSSFKARLVRHDRAGLM